MSGLFSDAANLARSVDVAIVRQVRGSVLDALESSDDTVEGRLDEELERALVQDLIARELDRVARARLAAGKQPLNSEQEETVRAEVFADLYGLGPLERYLADDEIENVELNGHDKVFVHYADGRMIQVDPLFGSDTELLEWLENAARRHGLSERRFDRAAPFLDLRLRDGSRLHAAREVTTAPVVTLRRHRFLKVTLADLAGLGTIDQALQQLCEAMVAARLNVLVCGAPDTGKTTFVRALVSAIDPVERLVVVEDDAELNLGVAGTHPNVVEMEARRANTEGVGEVAMHELVRQAKRMRPDRLIVGEVRGGEALEMLDAMATGTGGVMCTVHASSPEAACSNVIGFVQSGFSNFTDAMVARKIADGVDVIVHLVKPQIASSLRVVSAVLEVTDHDGAMIISNAAFTPGSDGRARWRWGFSDAITERLVAAGLDVGFVTNPAGYWQ